MDNESKFDAWLDSVCKRPLPGNEMARTRTLAKELAEGVSKEFWSNHIIFRPIGNIKFFELFSSRYSESDFQSIISDLQGESKYTAQYIYARWYANYFSIDLLRIKEYLDTHDYLTKSAFDLIDEIEPISIFISYKRSESSAFAMYALTRLKQEGLEAFVDMALIPGEDWHAGLEERIKEYDYLIALLGKETLKSDVCIKEIGWAINEGVKIIPVWHNKFKFIANKWGLEPKIENALEKKQAIQVKEESASGYNTAMVELLNVFGITP